MINLRIFKNSQGIGIVQVLIAGSLLAVVGAGVVQISKFYFQGEKRSNILRKIEEVSHEVDSLFRDSKFCRSTLLGKNPVTGDVITEISNAIGIEGLRVDEGISPDLDPDELASYNALTKKIFYKMDCPADGAPDQTESCTLGKGTPFKILLHSGRIYNYNPTEGSAVLEYKIRAAKAIGKDLGSFQDISLRGSPEMVKRMTLFISIDNNNLITNCVTKLENFFDENCHDLLSGNLDTAGALKCKNITIESNGTGSSYPDPAHEYAISVVDSLQTKGACVDSSATMGACSGSTILSTGSIKISNYVDIRSTAAGTMPSGSLLDGSIRVQESFFNKNNFTQGSGSIFFGPYNLEVLKLSNPSGGALMISGKIDTSFGKLELGNTSYLHAIGNLLGIQTAPTGVFNKTVGINGSMRTSGDVTVDDITNLNGNLTLGTTETFDIVSSKLQLSNLRVEIKSPYNQTNSDNYVATRQWVYNLFENRLGNVAINAFFNELIENAPASGLTSLRQSFCSRLNSPKSGTSGVPSGCTSHPSQSCAADEAMKGFNSSGNIICAKKFINTSCEVGMGTNTAGGLNCGNRAGNLVPYIPGMLI